MEGEGNRVVEVTEDTNRSINCEEASTRKDFLVQNNRDESQGLKILEKSLFLVIGALLLFCKEYFRN